VQPVRFREDNKYESSQAALAVLVALVVIALVQVTNTAANPVPNQDVGNPARSALRLNTDMLPLLSKSTSCLSQQARKSFGFPHGYGLFHRGLQWGRNH
jgi:hypothetical protein